MRMGWFNTDKDTPSGIDSRTVQHGHRWVVRPEFNNEFRNETQVSYVCVHEMK